MWVECNEWGCSLSVHQTSLTLRYVGERVIVLTLSVPLSAAVILKGVPSVPGEDRM